MVGLDQDEHGPVLVVEDDYGARDGIRKLIELGGYAVETAASGAEALRKLRAGLRPCIIILDLAMNDGSGFSFREAQLKDPQLADIPVIIQSGIYDVKSAAVQLGAVAYFRKPFEIDHILSAIHEHAQK